MAHAMSFSNFIIEALSINALSPPHSGLQITDVHLCIFCHLSAHGFDLWLCHDKFICGPTRGPGHCLWRSTLATDRLWGRSPSNQAQPPGGVGCVASIGQGQWGLKPPPSQPREKTMQTPTIVLSPQITNLKGEDGATRSKR